MRIYVTTQFEALHRWPNAPLSTDFLRCPHRHLFKVRFEMEVRGLDREVEFFALLEKVNAVIKVKINELDAGSCEDIALTIIKELRKVYPDRWMECTVSEDGENGAVLSIDKEGNFR